jgi:hypothetical protein
MRGLYYTPQSPSEYYMYRLELRGVVQKSTGPFSSVGYIVSYSLYDLVLQP